MMVPQGLPPKVAVVVPCYNAEPTLAATLWSAIRQNEPVDVVVVDDGSTDGSLALARTFEPLVRVISGPNEGVSAARNKGIEATSAEWIVFLDADDLLEEGTLAKRLTAAEESGADVIICDWLEIHDNGKGTETVGSRRSIDWHAIESDPELAVAVHVWATTAAILYRRSIVDKIGGFRTDLPIIQDARFLFDAAHHAARFAHSDHVGAKYRVLADSLSRRSPEGFWIDVLRNGRQIEELWALRGNLDARRREVLGGIFDNAARGLLRVGSEHYLEAVTAQSEIGRLSLHSRIAGPLASVFGVGQAAKVLALLGRS